VCLSFRVERSSKVGLVGFEKSWATNWVFVIVGIDTASCEYSDMNASLEAAVGKVEGTDNIVSDRLLLVILAPIDIRSAS